MPVATYSLENSSKILIMKMKPVAGSWACFRMVLLCSFVQHVHHSKHGFRASRGGLEQDPNSISWTMILPTVLPDKNLQTKALLPEVRDDV